MKIGILLFLIASFANALPNFPGAEGWGTDTKGGRGGRVFVVSNTNPSGAGSFYAAMTATGPRIIVFRTSGVIQMAVPDLTANGSFLTIAGQTSPGGITLRKGNGTILGSYKLGFHDGVFRHLRFRGSANTYDNLALNTVNNVVIDHCDFSGSSDEAFDICSSHHFTVQWTTIANSSDGQTYGHLSAYTPTSHISLHHLLYAHHVTREPHMHWNEEAPPDNGQIDFRNNVLYDNYSCDYMSIGLASGSAGELHFNLVGNYIKAGPSTDAECSGTRRPAYFYQTSRVYASDNYWIQKNGQNTSQVVIGDATTAATPYAMPLITTEPVQTAFNSVMNKVGAWPRDSMNARTVRETRSGTGQLRVDNDPVITSGPQPPADADLDGMPDFWESAMGLNANDSSDNNDDLDGDGYTNVEEYINDLALARVCEDYYNPVYPIPSNWADYNPSCAKALGVERRDFQEAAGHWAILLSPNPVFGGSINIRLGTGEGEVKIFDLSGRELASFNELNSPGWDGRNSRGNRVSPGVYIVQWRVEGRVVASRRLLVVR